MKTTMVMSMDEIKVPSIYSRPNPDKLQKCRQYYQQHGKLDRDIVIGNGGYIRDGYVGYLILKEFGVKEAMVICNSSIRPTNYKNNETLYVFGCHKPMVKEYCWRITKSTQYLEKLAVGNRILVNTKHGNKVVTVTRIEKLSKPPVERKVKKVIKCYDN